MKPTRGKVAKRDRKKQKVKYNVLFVPDVATADVKKFSVKLSFFSTLATVIILVIALLIIYCYYLSNHIVTLNSTVNTLRSQLQSVTEEKENLEVSNTQLQEKIVLLSDTVSEKLQAEEERNAEIAKEYIPSGFPLNGTATFDEDYTDAAGNAIVTFLGGEGVNVIASAKGVVSSVSGNADEGYTVTVDHQNGYYSIYINGSSPKVKEGDAVTIETVIFVIEKGHENLGYQIIKDGEYIDPLEIMEIYG